MGAIWRILRWFAFTIWFGVWACGISYLILSGTVVDPRDPFASWFSYIGCGVLILSWLSFSIYYAFTDEFPDG